VILLKLIQCLEDFLCKKSKQKSFLTLKRLNTLEFIFDPLIEYFSAEGKGASKKVLEENRGFLMEIIQMNNLKTEDLIKQYSSSKFKNPKIKV
jgi:hypothetical protein